jgi:hypothetical protein
MSVTKGIQTMIYKSEELSRNSVLNLFKNMASFEFDFEVNAYKIPSYKENYFRIFVDGNRSEFFEMFFVNGELYSFGYSRTGYSRRMEVTESGNFRVLTKFPDEIKKFMKHLIYTMNHEDYPYERTENGKKFLNFIKSIVK